MNRVCPLPIPWSRVYERLCAFALTHACSPTRPPMPLILAGWNFSTDREKSERWSQTVRWADANGCAHLVEGIPEQGTTSAACRAARVATLEAIGVASGHLFLSPDSSSRRLFRS